MTFDNKSRKKNFTQAKRDRNHTETDVWRNKKKKLFVLFFIFCFRLCCSSLDGRTSLSGHTLTAWTDCVLHFLALSSKNSLFTTWWCWDVLPFAIGFRWFKRSINRVLCMVHWAEVYDFEPLKGIAFIRIHLHLTTKKKNNFTLMSVVSTSFDLNLQYAITFWVHSHISKFIGMFVAFPHNMWDLEALYIFDDVNGLSMQLLQSFVINFILSSYLHHKQLRVRINMKVLLGGI